MLAGQRAADRDAEGHNFDARRDYTLKLFAIALVKKNERMKIAIASVKNISDAQIIFAADFFDAAQSLWQTRARDDAVLHVISGGEPTESAESIFPALP